LFDFGRKFNITFLEGLREAEKKSSSFIHVLIVFYLNILVRDLAFRLNPFLFISGFFFLIYVIIYNLFERDFKYI
jgi:hypothetical protein